MKYFVVGVLAVVLGFPEPAYAYIDPGTGSAIIQAVIAFLIAIPFVIKRFWGRIKGFFSKFSNR